MKRTLIILILAVIMLTRGKTQEPTSANTPDSIVYGYYYCFALHESGTVYYTPVFNEMQDGAISNPAIEQSWQAYVRDNLNQPDYMAFVAGPFITSDNATQDRQSWVANIPDTLNRQEVQYTYQPTR
jgi:hypothetical protein